LGNASFRYDYDTVRTIGSVKVNDKFVAALGEGTEVRIRSAF